MMRIIVMMGSIVAVISLSYLFSHTVPIPVEEKTEYRYDTRADICIGSTDRGDFVVTCTPTLCSHIKCGEYTMAH